MYELCGLIQCYVCLLLTMFLPSPPASNQCYTHGHRYNAIDQRACVGFAPSRNLHTQRNELIRLSDFLAGQTLFSHSIAPFVTFWKHAILESMLARLETSGRSVTKGIRAGSAYPY